jgi:hypothetical protein
VAKFILLPVLLGAGCLISGLYGALHNQISYSVSPDYFDAYKFIQFDVPVTLRDRVGASIVGWQASWWMAGTMHNFSYLGGFVGILTASAYLVVERIRMKRRQSRLKESSVDFLI